MPKNDPSRAIPINRCTAHRRNGDPCKNASINGSNVCRVHGGSAPQVRRAAQVRLAMASEVLVERLLGMAASGDVPAAVKLAAIRDALDRANVVGTQQLQVEVGVSRWDQAKSKFVRTVHIGELEAKALENVVDAELVEEDPEYEAMLDEQNRENETLRRKRKRNGHPGSLPSEDPWSEPATSATIDRPHPADFAVDPPTRKTDAEWSAEGRARSRRSVSGERQPPRRPKRR